MAALLTPHEKMGVPYALWIARQAAEALDALHTAGYLHGDVKPGNLVLSPEGHVTLIDLGCARRLDDEPALADDSLTGTPGVSARRKCSPAGAPMPAPILLPGHHPLRNARRPAAVGRNRRRRTDRPEAFRDACQAYEPSRRTSPAMWPS